MADAVEGIDDEWDEDIEVLVRVRVKAVPNPDFFEGWLGRTPAGLALNAASREGVYDLSNCDGYADLVGSAQVINVEEGY